MQAKAVDLAGLEQVMRSLGGRPRLVHHFATWCEPCEAELPGLAEHLRAATAGGVVTVAVSWDLFMAPVAPADAITACGRFLSRLGAGFEHLLVYTGPPAALFASQHVTSGTVPFTEVLDAAGARVAAFPSPIQDAAEHGRLRAALAAARPQGASP